MWMGFFWPHRLKDSSGWILAWCSPYLEQPVERLALNAKASGASVAAGDGGNCQRMLTVSYGSHVQLWSINAADSEGDR